MVWREPQNHHDDCYFCMVNIKGFNRYKRRKWEYPDLKSARRPVLHCESIPVPVFTSLPQLHDSDSKKPHELECNETSGGSCRECEERSSSPKQFTQQELNDLIRDLNLSKQGSELLASRLKEKKTACNQILKSHFTEIGKQIFYLYLAKTMTAYIATT